MKKIADFKEKEMLKQNLLIKSCVKGITNKGSSYLNLVLQDDSGCIDGKLWNAKESDIKSVHPGHVEFVTFEVLEYNHKLQLRVNKIEDIDQDSVNIEDFVISSKYSKDELKKQILELANSIQNDNYRAIVLGMLDRVGEDFYQYPAASRIHHNYLGGLGEHTIGMARVAKSIAELYPILDYDLLMAGVLVHDMGKTCELGGLITSEYTLEGKLCGHISIGQGWLMDVSKELGLENSEESILLRHMVLSHHGKMEYGSPILPLVPEAEALSLIDNLDARMNTMKKELEGVTPGHWSTKVFAMENRQFYKPSYKKEEE